jgi:hypothetical protein
VFEPNQRVCLLRAFGEVPAGTIGRIVGYYAYQKRLCLVDFGGGLALEVPPDQLVPVDDRAEDDAEGPGPE